MVCAPLRDTWAGGSLRGLYAGLAAPPRVRRPLCQPSRRASSWIMKWMSMSTSGARYARSAAALAYRAWRSNVTPIQRSGGFVWYPYSVSQIRFRGKFVRTSLISRSRSAIVIVLHQGHPPDQGVSIPGFAGYGWCAYASSLALYRRMARIQSTGLTPPTFPLGAVTPPA